MFHPENNTQLPEPEFGSAWLQAAEPAQACIEVFGKWAVERFENESLAKPKLTALLPAVQYVLEVGYEKDINMRAFLQSEAYHQAMSWLCTKSDRERITKNSATLHHTDRWLEILNAYDDISTLENIVVGAPSVDDELYRKALPYLQDRSRISGAESFSLHDALVEIERKRPHRIIQREIERSAKGQLAAYYESAGILAGVGFDFKLGNTPLTGTI